MTVEPFHVSDRYFFILTGLVIVATAGFVVWSYPYLPAHLPIHVTLVGRVDGWSNSPLMIFLPLVLQLLLTGLISWTYRHPQYVHLPHRLQVRSLPQPLPGQLIRIARHLVAVVNVLAVLILADLTEAMMVTGLGLRDHLGTPVMFLMVGFLLLVIGAYTLWINRLLVRPSMTTSS